MQKHLSPLSGTSVEGIGGMRAMVLPFIPLPHNSSTFRFSTQNPSTTDAHTALVERQFHHCGWSGDTATTR